MSAAEFLDALQKTEDWIRRMEQRIEVLISCRQQWTAKIAKRKQDLQDLERIVRPPHSSSFSDWNRACLYEMQKRARASS